MFLDVKIDWEYVAPFQWSLLGREKQVQATKFLLQAQALADKGANLVADHFLACIALHPESDPNALALLDGNKASWVQQALALKSAS